MNTPRTVTALLVATALALTGCAGGGDKKDGKVTISVNGRPPATQAYERKNFDADVAEFERTHPNIDIDAHEGFMDPKTFQAKLAGGKLEDVFYVYFTDPAQLIARRQAADMYMPSLPAPIIRWTSSICSNCLLPIELSVHRMSCRYDSAWRPWSLLNAAFQVSPSRVATGVPIE